MNPDPNPNQPRSDVFAQNLRGLLYDTGIFSEFDLFYTEYTVRYGIEAFMDLLQELLGERLEVNFMKLDPEHTLEQAVRYYTPFTAAMQERVQQLTEQGAQQEDAPIPALMLSDTVLTALLFVENGQPSLLFRTLYPIAFGHSHAEFGAAFRDLAASHSLMRHVGQGVHALYGGGRMPGFEAVRAYAEGLSKTAFANLTSPPAAPVAATPPAPRPAPTTQASPRMTGPAFDPNTLN